MTTDEIDAGGVGGIVRGADETLVALRKAIEYIEATQTHPSEMTKVLREEIGRLARTGGDVRRLLWLSDSVDVIVKDWMRLHTEHDELVRRYEELAGKVLAAEERKSSS